MQIHRVRGRNLREALERAQRAHGDAALVLSREERPDGVTLAVVERGRAAPRPAHEPPGLADVRARLVRHGASPELVERVLGDVRASGRSGAYAIDAAAAALGAAFPVAPAPRAKGGALALALLGASGSGKTTTLHKLARRMRAAGRRVARVELPRLARGDLAGALRGASELQALLVDVHGDLARSVAALRRAREAGARVEALIVAPATGSEALHDEVIETCAPLEPGGAVVTKLDESRRPLPVLEQLAARGLGLAFLCDGAGLDGHLHRARPAPLADLALRGRIA